MKLLLTVNLENESGEQESRMWIVDDNARLHDVLLTAALESYLAKPISRVRILDTREATRGEIAHTKELGGIWLPVGGKPTTLADIVDEVPLTCHKCRHQQPRKLGGTCEKCGSEDVWL